MKVIERRVKVDQEEDKRLERGQSEYTKADQCGMGRCKRVA